MADIDTPKLSKALGNLKADYGDGDLTVFLVLWMRNMYQNGFLLYPIRRKTPGFIHGDIRRNKYALKVRFL